MLGSLEIAGYVASGLVFLTFCMKTLIPLRILAIASNVAFIAYAVGDGLIPVLVLHAALLPLNVIRTAEQVRMRNRVRAAAQGDVKVEHLLPFMERRRCEAGEVIFRAGDISDFMFYLSSGRIRLEEIGLELGPGVLIGEIGLFAEDRQRTATVVCVEPSELCTLSAERVESLYHQNPEFGFFMIRLVTNRLIENQRRLEGQLRESREAAAAPVTPLAVQPASKSA